MSQKMFLISIHKSDLMLFSFLKKIFLLISLCWRSGDYLPSPPGFPNSPVKEQKNNRVHMGQINIITCKMVAIVNKTLECKFHFSSLFQDGHSSKLTFTLPILVQSKSKWFQNSNSTAFQKTAICKSNSKALKISLLNFFSFFEGET